MSSDWRTYSAYIPGCSRRSDPHRAAFLALWHDTQETRTTDLPHLTKRYVTTAANEAVTADQVRIGTALLAALIAAAAELGCRDVVLCLRADNARARELNLRTGFTEAGLRRRY
jgi:hypothetical protein